MLIRKAGVFLRRCISKLTTACLRQFGFSLTPIGLGYFNPARVVSAARQSGVTLCEYLENNNIGGVGRRRDAVIERLLAAGAIQNVDRILEIGPGTGMYLERVVELARPGNIELYETSSGWRNYLGATFGKEPHNLIVHVPDGKSLAQSCDCSVDVVYTHAVFVYLPLITTIGYLEECVRVLKPGGMLVFDVFLDTEFCFATIQKWRRESPEYAFPVVISRALLCEAVSLLNLQIVCEFKMNYHSSETIYFVCKKKSQLERC